MNGYTNEDARFDAEQLGRCGLCGREPSECGHCRECGKGEGKHTRACKTGNDYSDRTYYVGLNMERERMTITVNLPLPEIPFSVWRDLGRLAGCSISMPHCEVFEFLCNNPEDIQKGERILQGAFFTRE